MPARPPVFRPPGWKPRKPWAKRRGYRHKRIRGREGQRLRAEVLAAEPLCRSCRADGRVRRADVVDHIVPMAWGGPDVRWNKQPLCHECHDAKSLAERTEGAPPALAVEKRLRRLRDASFDEA